MHLHGFRQEVVYGVNVLRFGKTVAAELKLVILRDTECLRFQLVHQAAAWLKLLDFLEGGSFTFDVQEVK